jgi:hypothetical protein
MASRLGKTRAPSFPVSVETFFPKDRLQHLAYSISVFLLCGGACTDSVHLTVTEPGHPNNRGHSPWYFRDTHIKPIYEAVIQIDPEPSSPLSFKVSLRLSQPVPTLLSSRVIDIRRDALAQPDAPIHHFRSLSGAAGC